MASNEVRVENRFARGAKRLAGPAGWVVAALFLIPILLILYKSSSLPGADTLRQVVSLSDFASSQSRVKYVLFVPVGAVLIVLLRTVLGIRVLGPFRSILLALAFQLTGIVVGTVFLAICISVIALLSPALSAIRLTSYARVSTILSAVSIMIIVTFILGHWYSVDSLQQAVHFPIVVLCLTGDGFVTTMNREGFRSAMWRGTMTALAAILLTFLAGVDWITNGLLLYPELMLLEIGLLIVMATFFAFRVMERYNPSPRKSKKKKLKKVVTPESSEDGMFAEQLNEL